jgi:hypothetical protein
MGALTSSGSPMDTRPAAIPLTNLRTDVTRYGKGVSDTLRERTVNRPGFAGDSVSCEDWSPGQPNAVFAGGPRAGGADGPGACAGVPVPVCGDHLDRGEDWLGGGDVAALGAPAGAG